MSEHTSLRALNIVFQWVEQRRQMIIEETRLFNEAMLKSFQTIFRRIRMLYPDARGDASFTRGDVPEYIRRFLFGVRNIETREWIVRPDHQRAKALYTHYINRITAYRGPEGVLPRYFPGL